MHASKALVVAIAASCLAGCGSVADASKTQGTIYDALGQLVSGQGFTPNIPPSSIAQPGWLFVLVSDTSGKKFRRTICQDINADSPPRPSTIVVPTVASESDASVAVGLGFLGTILRTVTPIKAELERKNAEKVKFRAEAPKGWEMGPSATGERNIPTQCRIRIEANLNSEGVPTLPMFLVEQALSYESLELLFEGKQKLDFGVAVTGANALEAKAGYSANRSGDGAIKFTAPAGQYIYYGVHITEIKNAKSLAQVAATATMRFATETTTFTKNKDAFESPVE